MRRVKQKPRDNWQEIVNDLGLIYHSDDGDTYWNETASYEFDESEIDYIENASNSLHGLCLEAVDYIIKNKLYNNFNIPKSIIPLIESSWKRQDYYLYGRFDFTYDQYNNLKLLEYNADTPTALYEAAVVQWQWLEELFPGKDQFNFIHEQLIEQWQNYIPTSDKIHFSCSTDSDEDLITTEYLADLCFQAKRFKDDIDIKLLDITEIGWNSYSFTDSVENNISSLFKLYPWEWLVREDFGKYISVSPTQWIEPSWKMLLSNKALLPILWQIYPKHPNLLPSYYSAQEMNLENNHEQNKIVKKAILGREGANVSIISAANNEVLVHEGGPYADAGFVYQQYHEAIYNDYYPVLGVWMVGDVASGMGIRENIKPITTNHSHFIPHYFNKSSI